METRVFSLPPRVSASIGGRQRPWGLFGPLLKAMLLAGGLCLIPAESRADRISLVGRVDGNEVEVLEEREDVFIVKIPKAEVEWIKRETPTEIKLWKERKILWEDQGDYLVISLPKERIAPPPATTAEGTLGYAPAASLEEGLAVTGVQGRRSAVGVLTGDVTGRVLQHRRPLAGCRVRLSAIPGAATELTRLLGRKNPDASDQTRVEATTGANGVYLFEDMPIGDYDISFLPPGSTHWLGWFSDKPDVTVKAGEITTQQGDLDL